MKPKIKILHILTNLEICNGVTTYVMNYMENMDSNKFSVDFLVCNNNSRNKSEKVEEFLEKKKSKVFYIEQIRFKNMFKVIVDIKNFFSKNAKNYDIVHCHMLNNGAFFLHYAKKYGIKCRILHSHVTKSADTLLKEIRNNIFIPVAKKNATHYFACSNDAGKFAFRNNKFIVINNAIDPYKFRYDEDKRKMLRDKMGLKDVFVYGNIGRLCPQKNQIFLIDIFKNIVKVKKESKLMIIGDGPLENKIKKKIKELNLNDKIILLNSQDNIQDFYQVFDMFLFPTMYEGLGITLIEAQTSGLRCFVSNMVPIETKITENYRVQNINDSAEEWARNILHYGDSIYIRENKYDDIIKHGYSIKLEAKKLEKIYEKILKI